MNKCRTPRVFGKKEAMTGIENPLGLAQLPLIARLFNVEVPRGIRMKGLDGSEILDGPEELRALLPLPPLSKCYWRPWGVSLKVFEDLAEHLGLLEDRPGLVNYSPYRYEGVVQPGCMVRAEGGSRVAPCTPSWRRSGKAGKTGPYEVAVRGGSLILKRKRLEIQVEGFDDLEEYAGVFKASGAGEAYIGSTGILVAKSSALVVRHGMLGGWHLWIQPFAYVEALEANPSGEALGACISGPGTLCFASPGGVRYRSEGGVTVIEHEGGLWIGVSSRDRANLVAPRLALLLNPPVMARASPLRPVWSLSPSRILVYDAAFEDGVLSLALSGMGEFIHATLRVRGLIQDAWIEEQGSSSPLYPAYDEVRLPVSPGLTIMRLRVKRSPLALLRGMKGFEGRRAG